MADTCAHKNRRSVGDMPLADPDTLEFLGRFDVTICTDCAAILTKEPTKYPEPDNIVGA